VTKQPILLSAHNPSAMTGPGNNTYLVVGTDGQAALIDAGVGHAQHLTELADRLSAERCELRHVLVTHGHADHASGAPALATQYPAAAFSKFPWPGEDNRYAVEWRTLADGDTVSIGDEVLTALHTPGHSPDHLAFWIERTRTIFSGDLVIPGRSVMIHTSAGGNLAQYLASLERLLALDALVLLPGHGPRIDTPAEVLNGHLEHRRMRERQVLDALRAGRATVETIAESIYDGLEPALMPAARENVRAHLEKLHDEGLVVQHANRWHIV
jgi:glyoxylase-like metal-dependent hydrolase (beta-lactamase superfamily II)